MCNGSGMSYANSVWTMKIFSVNKVYGTIEARLKMSLEFPSPTSVEALGFSRQVVSN